MNGKLPPSASVALPSTGAKLYAPSAASNADAISSVLRAHAPTDGRALEIASGTGQHVVTFARALPDLVWQPTEIDPARRASIDAHASEAGLGNLCPALALDATAAGWHREHRDQDMIVLINLLHLIPTPAARTVVEEAVAALAPGGVFLLYGPFKRDGKLISAGDMQFDRELRKADPAIGYKSDRDIAAWLSAAGARIQRKEMPANNLCLIAGAPRRSKNTHYPNPGDSW
jgi:SAM-dependent methyltransferase